MVCPHAPARTRTSGQPGRGRAVGFTLVEVLVVVSILTVLLLVAVPALSGVMQAMSLGQGGGKVVRVMEAARQRAVTGNVLTAVVLVTHSGHAEDGRALTVLECPPGGPWVQTGEWTFLPEGVVVDLEAPEAATFVTRTPVAFPFHSGQGAPVKFRNTDLTPGRFAGRIFLPSGGLLNPNDPAELQVVSGEVADGGMRYSRTNGAGRPADYYRITLVGGSGRSKVDRP